jgi:glycosyltransferase involved in cell wall biosynthesis
MNEINISYLVTCHNEGKQISNLLDLLFEYKNENEIVILDDYSTDVTTCNYFSGFKWYEFPSENVSFHQHALNNDYGAHKNYGNSLCKGKYIFQIDADETPHEVLLTNLKTILDANPAVDLFWVPRINRFEGITPDDINRWSWRMNEKGWVNHPDYQARIYRNHPDVKWHRKLHETITGMKSYAHLPASEELSLYHDKTIEKQRSANERYNRDFSKEDNMRL